MIFNTMPFATSRPNMTFGAPFQGHDPFMSGFHSPSQLNRIPAEPAAFEIPIKRMDRQSPAPGRPSGESPDSVVYNIPIHVEGRDDGHAVPQRQFPADRRPQSPRTRTPDQQMPAGDASSRQLRPGVSASKQRSVTPEVIRDEEAPISSIPVHMETTSKPRDRSNSPAPAPKKKKTPQEQIDEANSRLQELRQEVENFSGSSSDKQYRYLDEMLTRLLISLDNVDTEGNEQLRLARKETVRSIQQCADFLESKGKEDQPAEEMSQTQPEAPAAEPNDSAPDSNSDENVIPASAMEQPEKMDTQPSDDGNCDADESPIPTASSNTEAKDQADSCSNESHL